MFGSRQALPVALEPFERPTDAAPGDRTYMGTGIARQGSYKPGARAGAELEFRSVRTNVRDDIFGVATSLSTGYFQNIGGTRRQGVEFGLHYQQQRCSVFLNYSYVAATFESALLLPSPQNPFADAQGNVQVMPGDHFREYRRTE